MASGFRERNKYYSISSGVGGIVSKLYELAELFANGTNRIDSDIDLVVNFKEDSTYEGKVIFANEFNDMMFSKCFQLFALLYL